ncbi:DUF2612 domain-containing protein [Asaia astilbis]|uniref:DUF2612 domain-containing protein n=1 Tax=Asaia astilbis TaxID=610244 RepID=UPI00047288CC|nr:DUF2612 domain-containing protein [Asaia astilbis]
MDISETILSQYQNANGWKTIIYSFAEAVDPDVFFDAWYEKIWNPRTAVGIGLDIWGRIVGVGRVLQVASDGFIGFEEAEEGGTSTVIRGFNRGVFYSGQPTTSNVALTDEAYRSLIFAKAAANITDCSITSINSILMSLFGYAGRCYVIDTGKMTMTYKFEFVPTPVELSIIYRSGVLPQPTGVAVSYAFNE